MEIYRRVSLIENDMITAAKRLVTRNFDTHQHEYFEMEYILRGSGSYEIDGISYAISPGTLFFVTPANFHAVQTSDTELINISFSYTADGSDSLFLLSSCTTASCITLTEPERQLIRLLAEDVVNMAERQGFPSAFLFLQCILRKLTLITHTETPRTHSHVRQAVMYILENFTEDISLEETAAHIGLSKEYLSELFSRYMGIGFKKYLDSLRFEYAKKLLAFSSLSIFDVCGKCGFSNYANFSRRFKEKYGVTPSEYRQNQRQNLQISKSDTDSLLKSLL